MRKLANGLALLWMVGAVSMASAEVKPNPLFSANCVLQREIKLPVWGTADKGEKVTVRIQGQEATTEAGQDGKWMVHLHPLKVGGPFDLTIAGSNTVVLKNVMVGDVWICSGQSNMEMHLASCANAQQAIQAATNPKLRLFTVPKKPLEKPQSTVGGSWVESAPDTVKNFSAVAYYFGRDLQKELDVPIGLIHTSWGGTICEAWARAGALEAHPDFKNVDSRLAQFKVDYQKALEKHKQDLAKHPDEVEKAKKEGKKAPPAPKAPGNPDNNPNRPSVLYNGMIAPLIPYGIRGAIWYQGESNASRAYQYRTLFPLMIKNWREDWKQGEFPFLFVQLAPWQAIVKDPQESSWAELREAQLFTLKTPNTGMAVITDVGDEKDIHPKQKEPVGARLALAARALAHGQRIVHSGPIYDSMKVDGNKIVLSFKHVGGGLVARGGELKGFAIAGEDRKFVWANAKIEGDTVVVSSSQVANPVAVRYGWANCPVINLENKEGLQASPFRTDDFPMVTKK